MRSGTKLVSYEILGSLGAGGMGEVYRARDTKLGREVAVKVLPEALAGDRERCAPGSFTLPGVAKDSPAPLSTRTYDVAPDGRILAVRREAPTERSRAVLVENWFDELERLAPR